MSIAVYIQKSIWNIYIYKLILTCKQDACVAFLKIIYWLTNVLFKKNIKIAFTETSKTRKDVRALWC